MDKKRGKRTKGRTCRFSEELEAEITTYLAETHLSYQTLSNLALATFMKRNPPKDYS